MNKIRCSKLNRFQILTLITLTVFTYFLLSTQLTEAKSLIQEKHISNVALSIAYVKDVPKPFQTDCTVCHTEQKGGELNNFGLDFKVNDHSIEAIEDLDSDGDGFTNSEELKAGTYPGDPESHPEVAPTQEEEAPKEESEPQPATTPPSEEEETEVNTPEERAQQTETPSVKEDVPQEASVQTNVEVEETERMEAKPSEEEEVQEPAVPLTFVLRDIIKTIARLAVPITLTMGIIHMVKVHKENTPHRPHGEVDLEEREDE
ncbi:MAG: thrombospondin type 3 repeat-containing protein [Candidatus Geothermarchaeales archaeon]